MKSSICKTQEKANTILGHIVGCLHEKIMFIVFQDRFYDNFLGTSGGWKFKKKFKYASTFRIKMFSNIKMDLFP